MACHLPADELPNHFEEKDVEYDGHTTEEKLDRIQRWIDGWEATDEADDWKTPVGAAIAAGFLGASAVAPEHKLAIGAAGAGLGFLVGGMIAGYQAYCRRTRIWGSEPIHRRILNAVTNPRSMRKT